MFEDVWIGSSQRRFPTSKINIITCYYKSKGKIEVVHMFKLPVVPLEAVPEVSKGRKYNPSEHVPIEPFAQNIPASTANAHSVLQSPTPYYSVLLLRTTKHCSSTTKYKVLQSTTPVLFRTTLCYKVPLRTTKYYSSTTLYYEILHSTTMYYKNLVRTTKYYTVLLRTTKFDNYYTVLQCTTKD